MSAQERKRPIRWRMWAVVSAVLLVVGAAGLWGVYTLWQIQKGRLAEKHLASAREAVEDEEWAAAAINYRACVEKFPDDTDVLREYGDVLLKILAAREDSDLNRRWGQAAGVFERLARVLPDSERESKIQALKDLAGLYMGAGQFDQVLYTVADRWLPLAPDALEAVVMRADALAGLDRTGDARKVLEQALEKHPDAEEIHVRLIQISLGPQGDADAAGRLVVAALEACPESWLVRLAAYNHAVQVKDNAAADRYLKEALRLGPKEVRVLVTAVQDALRRGAPEEAKAYLDRARPLVADAGAEQLLVLTAEAQWAKTQSSNDERLRVADALVAAAREVSVPLLAPATELYLQANDVAKADHCIDKLATQPQADPLLPALRGARELAAGRADKAVPLLEEGLAKQPFNGTTAYMLGLARLQAGARGGALEAFRKASVLQPDAVLPRLQIAQLAMLARKPREADTQITAVLNTDPDNRQALRLRMRLDLLNLSTATSRDAGALAALQKRLASAMAAEPENVELIGLSAAAYLLGGRQDEAKALLRSKMSVPSLSEQMGLALADVYVRSNDTDAALKLLREVRAKSPASEVPARRLVDLLVREHRLDEAEKLVVETGDDALKGRLWRALGTAAGQVDEPGAALHAYEQAVALLPDDIATRQRLLRFKEIADDPAHTERIIKEIEAIEGADGVTAKVERARVLLSHKEQQPSGEAKAIEILKAVAAKRSSWVLPILMLAQTYDESGDPGASIEQYAKAMSLSPDLVHTPMGLRYTVLLKQAGRFAEADALMARILERQADAPSSAVLFQLAEQKSREGDWNAAAKFATELLGKQSDNAALAAMTADAQLRAGRPEDALKTARNAVKLAPDALNPLRTLVSVLLVLARNDEAEQQLRAYIESHKEDAQAHLLLGRVLAASGRMTEADQAYDRGVSLAPDQQAVLRHAGEYYRLRGNREKQLDYLRKSIALRGEDPDLSPDVARVLLTSTQPADRETGTRMVERAMAAAGAEPDPALLTLSAGVLAGGPEPDYDEAIARVERALAQSPRRLDAHRLLAQIHTARRGPGDLDAAYEACSRALSVAPRDAALFMQRGNIAMLQGNWTSAEADFGQAVKLAPENPAALGALARAIESGAARMRQPQRRKSRLARAEALLAKRSEQNPTREIFVIDLIQFLGRQHRYADLKALAEPSRADVDDAQAIQLAAASQVLLGDKDPERQRWAMGVLDGLIAASYRVGAARVVKGIHFQQQNRTDEAESVLRQAVDAEPDNGEAVNALAWVCCEDRNEPQRAFNVIDPYIQRHPNHLEALDTYGVILFRLGKTAESIDVFKKCIAQAAPSTVVEVAAKFHLGRSLCKEGGIADGQRLIAEALEHELSAQAVSDRGRKEAEALLK